MPRDRDAGEFIAELTRIGRDELAKERMPPDQAEAVVRRMVEAICAAYASSEIYVPMLYDPRNREIVAKYNQASRTARPCTHARVVELGREFGLTTRRVYAILRESIQADFQARQGQLPGLDPEPESGA